MWSGKVPRLPEKLSRGRRVFGQAVKETKIGYLIDGQVHADRLPSDQDSEQDCDRAASGPIIYLKIRAGPNAQAGFLSHLAFERALKRFVASDFTPRQRPKSQARSLANKQKRALIISIHALTETSFFGLNLMRFFFGIL